MVEALVLKPGMIFGRDFRIARALKAGGMGAVYIVDQLSTGKQRALKIMSPEFAQNQASRERFVLEARAASRIESDHVVEIVTAGVDDETGAPFIVMELLRGEELADVMDRTGPLPLGDTREVLTQIGHALEQAHAQGIVHRDIKPENIFLAASRRRDTAFTAKVLDFGIAKLVADSAKTGTQPLGTPLFMSPEQTERKGKISPATDVWALGLLAFQMLTGRPFWTEADGSLAGLLREICMEDIPPATARAREMGVDRYLPPGFDAWFARCVSRESSARFPEAGAAVHAFAELVSPDAPRGGLVIEAPPTHSGGLILEQMTADFPTNVRVAAGSAPLPLVTPAGQQPPAAGSSTAGPVVASESMAPATMVAPKKNELVLVLAAAAAVVVGGGLFLLFGMKKSPPPPSTSAPAGSTAAQATPPVPTGAAGVQSAMKCPEGMITIPGGKMFMGARDLTPDAKPPHEVLVAGFCLDRTEVTTAAYTACVSTGECERALDKVSWPDIKPEQTKRYSPFCNASHKEDRGEHPINCVAWPMADRYCKKKGARLPTEAEWEFAARGSSQRKFPWGDDEPNEKFLNACGAECEKWGAANGEPRTTMYSGDDGFPSTAPVGSFPAGAATHGVMDLAGNVWEWTSDWYAPYTADGVTNPKGPETGDKRVVRGGDFFGSSPDWARPAYRWKTDPETYNHAIGFRCAADAK